MVSPSTQDIQEHIRQLQLVGYVPYIPPSPYPFQAVASNLNPQETFVNIGKNSLLGIAFSLMLLGAFTFLGGFFLGIWIAKPQVTQPLGGYTSIPQNVSYAPAHGPYPQHQPQESSLQEDLGRDMGYPTKENQTSAQIHGEPANISPILREAQEETGKLDQREDLSPSHPPTTLSPVPASSPPPVNQYVPQSAASPQQLPVITSQRGTPSVPFRGASVPLPSQEADGGYTVQLGEYVSIENANALVNHLRALNFPSQITEGKAADGHKIYYVHSGFYTDYTTAFHAVTQFTTQNIPNAIIVKISQ